MKAGSELKFDTNLPKWRAALVYISNFVDITTWGLGRWVKPDWDEPLPDVLVLDKVTLNKIRGLPFLYRWRVDALDLTSLGAGAALKKGSGFLARMFATSSDFAIFNSLGYGISNVVGPSRGDDEILIPGEDTSWLYWLSAASLLEQGYTEYDVVDGNYVFYR